MRSIYRVLSTGIAYNGVNSITGVSQWVHRVTIHNQANVLYHKHELHPMFTQVTCQQKIHCYTYINCMHGYIDSYVLVIVYAILCRKLTEFL